MIGTTIERLDDTIALGKQRRRVTAFGNPAAQPLLARLLPFRVVIHSVAVATGVPVATLRAATLVRSLSHGGHDERPHEALDQYTPASCYMGSAREMPNRLPPLEYRDRSLFACRITT